MQLWKALLTIKLQKKPKNIIHFKLLPCFLYFNYSQTLHTFLWGSEHADPELGTEDLWEGKP